MGCSSIENAAHMFTPSSRNVGKVVCFESWSGLEIQCGGVLTASLNGIFQLFHFQKISIYLCYQESQAIKDLAKFSCLIIDCES